jgi:hypothetical protein
MPPNIAADSDTRLIQALVSCEERGATFASASNSPKNRLQREDGSERFGVEKPQKKSECKKKRKKRRGQNLTIRRLTN